MTLLPLQASPPPFAGAGEAAALAAAVSWGFATVLFTLAMRRGRASDAVLFKNAGGALVLAAVAWLLGPRFGGGAAHPDNLAWLLLSGALGLGLGDWLYFVALRHIGVGRTLILGQSLPLLTALLAWLWIGETLSNLQMAGAVLIIAGGLLAESRRPLRPDHDWLGVGAALGSVLAFALGNVTLYQGVTQTGAVTGASWRLAGGAFGIVVLAACRGEASTLLRSALSRRSVRLYLLPSALGTWFGMSLMAAGFKWSKQGVASALAGATPLISIPLAVWILGERPGWRGWCGAVAVVVGVAMLALAVSPSAP